MKLKLEPEQIQLLRELAEAARSVERAERTFFVFRLMQADLIQGAGLNREVTWDDVMQLERVGYLRATDRTKTSLQVVVTVEGFEFIEEEAADEPLARVEEEVTARYLSSDDFRTRHPNAYRRWAEAAALLWGEEAEANLTTIGHKAREAVQEFATSLLAKHSITDANPDPTRTVARLKAVVAAHRGRLGEARSHFLDALIIYWGEVLDLVQRQEHGGQKEGEPLTWEDGRRAVFQTAIVMYEIDRTL